MSREGGRPPPAPLLLVLLHGRRSLLPSPPSSSLLPPSQRHPRTARPPRPPSLPRAADVAERPGAGRPRQGSPRPVSLAPGPPPAPALPLARPPLSPDRRNPQPEPVSPAAEVGSPRASRREDADPAGDLPTVRGRGARGSPPLARPRLAPGHCEPSLRPLRSLVCALPPSLTPWLGPSISVFSPPFPPSVWRPSRTAARAQT